MKPPCLRLKNLIAPLLLMALMAAGPASALPTEGFNASAAQQLVREYLQANLTNPDTYEPGQWSRLVTHRQGGAFDYTIRHTYWVTPQFGKPRRMDCIFHIDPDGIISGVEMVNSRRGPRPHRHRP